jgi:hypothetical protein
MSTAYLLWSVLFSGIGLGYFVYGKRQQNLSALLSGIALLVAPYFLESSYALVGVSGAFMALPFMLDF